MSESVLYYEFEFKIGTNPNYAGVWHYAAVTRVTPDGDVFIGRERCYFRWTAKRAARRMAKADLKWIAACAKDEKVVWRP